MPLRGAFCVALRRTDGQRDRVEVISVGNARALDDAAPCRSHLVQSAGGSAQPSVDPAELIAQTAQIGFGSPSRILQLVAGLDSLQLDLEALQLGLHRRDALGDVLVHRRPLF
jgi:hypothetical protein